MALVKPLRALRYNPEQVRPEHVIAPPYDVISKSQEEILRHRSPYNAIYIELGTPPKNVDEESKRYEESRSHLNQWLAEKVLISENQDSYYLYRQTYLHPFAGKKMTRFAFFGRLKLEPFGKGVVFPHEKTHSTAKTDRKKLLRATETNFSPVFMLYDDPEKTVEKIYQAHAGQKSIYDFLDPDSTQHTLWQISDPAEVNMIQSMFGSKQIFIADGHHRYETALGYSEEARKAKGAQAELNSDYVLCAFVNTADPGLLILPIHRVIHTWIHGGKEPLLKSLAKDFRLQPIPRHALDKLCEGREQSGIGLACSPTEFYLLELKDPAAARKQMPAGKPDAWYGLDVTVVSYMILEPILKITSEILEDNVSYTPRVDEALAKLEAKEASCVFFVRPIVATAIRDICETGELMPQKSTYFFPKFPSGLVMYKH